MKNQESVQTRLRKIPSVDIILERISDDVRSLPYPMVISTIRTTLAEIRTSILDNSIQNCSTDEVIKMISARIKQDHSSKLINVINGTGIVLHTGLGRAPISQEIMQSVCSKTTGYLNLELDIQTGTRGERTDTVRTLINALTGAESSLVVNNNAAAVLLMLNTLAEGKEVLISRGQQVEIGGSFRIPDVIHKSGCIMREVGTTNKTHLRDYENAITKNTGAILVVHTSNFKIEGFTQQVEISELSSLCKKKRIPLLMDLGSGAIANLTGLGLPYEPEVRGFLQGGSTIVTFSGDKLLGGPQAGIICGKKTAVNRIHKNPLYRALRVDKFTFALLDETLRTYHKSTEVHPKNLTLFLLQRSQPVLFEIAKNIIAPVDQTIIEKLGIQIRASNVEAGSGSLPTEKIPSVALVCSSVTISAAELAARFRKYSTPILGYIHRNRFRIDLKAVLPQQEVLITNAIIDLEL